MRLQVKQCVVAAVLAAGSLLVYPLQASAQDFEKNVKGASLLCGYLPEFSFAAMQNLNGAKQRSVCKWKCLYKFKSGAVHVNAGTRTLAYQERVGMNTTKKVAPGLVTRAGGTGSCS